MEGIVPVVHSLVSVSRAEICQTVAVLIFMIYTLVRRKYGFVYKKRFRGRER